MAARFAAGTPRSGARDPCAWPTRCASTSPPTSAIATQGRRTTAPTARLAEICSACIEGRYPAGHGLARAGNSASGRELEADSQLDLSGFFVLHHDLLELAREVAVEVRGPSLARSMLPPGRGRGSSVSSIVCYLTGLSHIDPLKNELFLGRFLNDEITALPDIDLDFPRDIREVLIPRVHERYGTDRSALVAAFPTFRARGAIREIGKALGLPPGEIEKVAKGSEAWSALTVGKDIDVALGEDRRKGGPLGLAVAAVGRGPWPAAPPVPALGRDDRRHPLARGLLRRGARRDGGPADGHVGQGLLRGRGLPEDRPARARDAVGGRALRGAHRRPAQRAHRPVADPLRRPGGLRGDPARGDHGGLPDRVAGADGLAAAHAAREPRRPDDPGGDRPPRPIQGGRSTRTSSAARSCGPIPRYVVPYEHPSLEPVLRDTLGTIIFQDQVIEVAMAFAGFSPGEAEGLRRAMSRKRSTAAMEAYHVRFVQGAMSRFDDVTEELAERVFTMIVGFSGFGFPKAHGAAFGLLAYQSTWLRVHYAPEFLCSLLDEQPMGFYPSDALVHEAQRRGIEVLPPEVNASRPECTVTPQGDVRLGLDYVMGVRTDEIRAVVAARDEGGPFRTLDDLAARAGAGRSALDRLAWSGACDALAGGDRRVALWRLGVAAPGRGLGDGMTQLSLPLEVPEAPALRELGGWDAMVADYATTGLTTQAHPLGLMRAGLAARGAVSSADLTGVPHGTKVQIGGLVVARQRPGTAKGVAFLLIEDEVGTVNLVVSPGVYERDRIAVRSEPIVLAQGRLERHPAAGGAINVVVERLTALEAPAQAKDGRWRRFATSRRWRSGWSPSARPRRRRAWSRPARPRSSSSGGAAAGWWRRRELPRGRPGGAELRAGEAALGRPTGGPFTAGLKRLARRDLRTRVHKLAGRRRSQVSCAA
jgi:error-prone DNA polymerase